MLNRKVFVQLEQWLKSGIRKAAFLDGARQVCPKATTTARIWRMPCFSNFTGNVMPAWEWLLGKDQIL